MSSQAQSTPDAPETTLNALTSTITKETTTYLTRLQELNQEINFNDPFPPIIQDATVQEAKLSILRSCEKLMALVQGGVQWLMFQNMAFVDPACIGAAIDLGIPDIIKVGDEATGIEEIVEATGADKEVIRRIMRVCTQRLFFEEVEPDKWVHNAVSLQMLAPPVQALISHCCDDGLRIAGSFGSFLRNRKYQESDQPGDSAFKEAFNTDKTLFDHFYTDDTTRGQRFALGMAGSEMVKTLTEDIYPFDSLPPGSKVVDVGGSRGHVSVRIAEKVPNLNFVVQDDEGILEAGQAEGIPESVKDRIEFMPHDFFNEQPVQGAEVYLLRFILHDHPDAACTKILKHIVKAMEPGKSRILIDDAVVPGVLGQDSVRFFNFLDMYMMMAFNGKERTEWQWNDLFKMVDERLMLEKIWRVEGSGPEAGAVLELKLREE